MKKQNYNPANKKVSEFIKSLSNVSEISKETKFEMFFSISDEGILVLDGEDRKHYRETLKSIVDTYGSEKISQDAIEKLFQKTILTVLDINERRKDKTFLQRLNYAMKEFQKSLLSTPSVFEVYYPIDGLSKDDLPRKIGNIQFCVFDSKQFTKFYKILHDYKGDAKIMSDRADFAETIRNSPMVHNTVGLVEINAVDSEAAKISAIKELSFTRDIINFYSDLIPYQKGNIFLPGEKERRSINIAIIEQGPKPNIIYGGEIVGPLIPLSFKKLFEVDEKKHLGFSKVINLLSKEPNELEERLLASMQWAGRATIETIKEDAFLFYVISLESLILKNNERERIGYRLRTRVAQLLGDNPEDKRKIEKNIKKLYNIRSEIVHSGSFQVTDAELYLIRSYTKGCILRILNDEPFTSMTDKSDLAEWFEDNCPFPANILAKARFLHKWFTNNIHRLSGGNKK